MKKIGLLSDTHGYMDDRILHHLKNCDEIWHAGDWGNIEVSDKLKEVCPVVKGVYGNIDGKDVRITYPKNARFNCEEMDIWITHIGGYPGKYSLDVREEIKKNPPDVFICGHSHILKVMRDPKLNLLHINPGAAGRSGFHKIRTMVLLEIDGNNITKLQAVELGPRTKDN